MLMIAGYATIAIPTGIVTVELAGAQYQGVSTQACPACSREGHDVDARYCKRCGAELATAGTR
jgi:voltage-gated potassium channel